MTYVFIAYMSSFNYAESIWGVDFDSSVYQQRLVTILVAFWHILIVDL